MAQRELARLGEATLESAGASRFRRAALSPIAPVAVGAAALLCLLAIARPPVHFSGDGAVKERMIRQWLAAGNVSAEVAWPGAPGWAEEFWAKHGGRPLSPPFTHDGKSVFPPLYLMLTLPFYAAFGYRGLFALPALSILGLWALAWRWLAARGIGGFPAFVGLALLVFSPLTFYGAIFWEHAPGVFCLMLALGLAGGMGREKEHEREGLRDWRMLAAGAAAGMAAALRPELAPAGALAFGLAVWGGRVRGGAGFIAGGLATAALFVAANKASTGAWLGIHHRQTLGFRSEGAAFLAEYWGGSAAAFALRCKGIALAALASLALAPRFARRDPERAALAAVLPLTLAILPFIVPNDGGQQIFRRYELAAIPAGALLAAHLAREQPKLGWALLALVALDLPFRVADWRYHGWAYGDRERPALEEIRARRPKALLIGDKGGGGVADWSSIPYDGVTLRFETEREGVEAVLEAERRVGLANAGLLLFQSEPRPEITIRASTKRSYIGRCGKPGPDRYSYYTIEPAR